MRNGNNHALLREQEVGTQFSGVYYVAGVSVKNTRTNNEYMKITLMDRSGSVFANLWEVNKSIQKGMYVSASINVDTYNTAPSYTVRSIVEYRGEVDQCNYMAVVDNPEELKDKFNAYMDILKDYSGVYFDAVKSVFTPEFTDRFFKAPANAGVYYGKVGGALENVINICSNCMAFANTYKFTDDEKAVLLASALLSKAGCVDAYQFENCAVAKTVEGELIGEANLTSKIVQDAFANLSGTAVSKILHGVVSRERSDALPMTKDAILLHSVLDSDRRMVEMFDYIARDEHVDENGFTSFDSFNRRKYFVK